MLRVYRVSGLGLRGALKGQVFRDYLAGQGDLGNRSVG